jgi:hypothetical protein
VKCAAIPDENNAKVTPPFRPKLIHLRRLGVQAKKTFVVFGRSHGESPTSNARIEEALKDEMDGSIWRGR